jgi:hypothetical protein
VTLQVDVNSGAARSAVITSSSAGGAVPVTLQQGAAPSGGTSPPVNSRVMGVPARASVQLTWAPAVENGSGVSGYKVVWAAGSTAPRPRCTTGTVVPRQASISSNASGSTYRVRVTGLQPATRYAFRVCAVDAAGNVSTGSVWRGSTRP